MSFYYSTIFSIFKANFEATTVFPFPFAVDTCVYTFKCGYGAQREKAYSFSKDPTPLKTYLIETGRLSLKSHRSELVWISRKP